MIDAVDRLAAELPAVANWVVMQVVDAELVSGTWVPKRAVRRVSWSDTPDRHQEKTYEARLPRVPARRPPHPVLTVLPPPEPGRRLWREMVYVE